MRRATGSVGVAALLLSCGSPKSDPLTGEQCLLGHPAGPDVVDELRRIELHARQTGVAWPQRCGAGPLYEGQRISPRILAALKQPAIATEPPPSPLALPSTEVPAGLDEAAGVKTLVLHGKDSICTLVGDALHCKRTAETGVLEPRWDDGPPVLRVDNRAIDAVTGAAITHGDQLSIGERAYAVRDGTVVVDELIAEKAPPGVVLVRDQLVWWENSQLVARQFRGWEAVIGGFDKGASAPDARQRCAGPDVAAVRLTVGGRIAVMAGKTWQIYEAPGGPLWCHGQVVTTISPSGERQDCTAGGCPKVGGKVRAPAGAVVAPFGSGVIAAWVDDEVRVELPSHQQIIAFDGYKTTKSFVTQQRVDRVGIFTHGDDALLLLHGEKELAVKIGADGQLTALRVVVE